MALPKLGPFPARRLAFAVPMLKVQPWVLGDEMGQTSEERAKALAQNLVDMLASYEEELMVLEREAPVMSQLRRAVGIAIAEACYLITDQGIAQAEWAPP
ncbi:MAG: hypothetical protein ACXWKM_02410, partial [Phenylobacterium sp.]